MSLSDDDRKWIEKTIAEKFAEFSPPPKKKKRKKKSPFGNTFKKHSASLYGGGVEPFYGHRRPHNLQNMSFHQIEDHVLSLGIRSQIPEDMRFSWDEIDGNNYKL